MTSMTVFGSRIHLQLISYDHPISSQIVSYKISHSSFYSSSSSPLQAFHPIHLIPVIPFPLNESVYFIAPESTIQSYPP